ncbi:MAG TPA: Ig-like domain-containing protein [Candidatus Limnocylindrales bacterium]
MTPPLRRSARHRGPAAALIAILLVCLAPAPAQASSVIRAFTARYSTNDRGGITLIGNTVLTCPADPTCTDARNGTGASVNNNDFTMAYVDVDADGTTFTSSSADLDLPNGAQVLFAGLYWAADSASASRDTVRFALPGGGYQTRTADQLTAAANNYYMAFDDVTALVQPLSNPDGTYTVANVQATVGATNHAGGWSLVVVYEDLVTPAPLRNLVVFDGLAQINTTAPTSLTTTVSGFLTPAAGPVTAHMGMVTVEGDLGPPLMGDQFQVNGTDISDAANPIDNTFNSSISELGTTVTSKNPNYLNQLGFDIDLLDATGTIANLDTSADLTFTTAGDVYYPLVLTSQIDVFLPNILAPKSQVDVNGGVLNVGDEIQYTVDVTNNGNDPATLVVLTDPIPTGTTYVADSLSIVTGPGAGALTDASGDDRGEYDGVGDQVVVRLGAGGDATNGGQLDPGDSTSIRFRVAVGAGVVPGQPIENQATITYSSLSLGGSFSADSDGDNGTGGDQPTTITVNAAPVANDDSATTPEDTAVDIDVLANDSDVDGNLDPTSVTVTSGPGNGSVTVDPVTGVVTYTPAPDWSGTDTFTYQVCDTSSVCDSATVTVDVTAVNDPPVANDDSATTAEDGAGVAIDVLANDTDPEGALDATSVSVTSGPANGSTSVDPVTGEITYTPDPDFSGIDTFTYQVCDTPGACDTAVVTVTVTGLPDPPVANDDSVATSEDTPILIDVLANDVDPDGDIDPTSVTVQSGPANGTTSVDPVTGLVTYTPDPDWNGSDSFTYEVCDLSVPPDCSTATVTIDVSAVNDPPVATDDSASTPEDTATTIDVVANDTDTEGGLDPTTVSVTAGPANGSVSVDPVTGEITYTPDPDFAGTDTFTYQVCDVDGACDTATVTVDVGDVNDPPVAVDDAALTGEDTPVDVDVVANDGDPDGTADLDASTVSIVSGPANGTVLVDPVTGVITYTPDPNFNGSDSLVYEICDGSGECDTATVTITVTPVPDPPIGRTDRVTTSFESTIVIDVLANDSDPDGDLDPTSVTIVSPPSSGAVTVDPVTGAITYSPDDGQVGADTFTYQVCDLTLRCVTVEVVVFTGAPPTHTAIMLPGGGAISIPLLPIVVALVGLLAAAIFLGRPSRRREDEAGPEPMRETFAEPD